MRPLTLVILLVFGVTGSAAAEDRADRDQALELELDRWDRSKEDVYIPPACVTAERFQLAGEWSLSFGLSGTSLEFTANDDGSFDVLLSTAGCLGAWRLERTARIEGGAVVLNRPVRQYVPITYTRLWPVEVGPYREVVLVPTPGLEDVRKGFKAGGCTWFNATFESHLAFVKQHETTSR